MGNEKLDQPALSPAARLLIADTGSPRLFSTLASPLRKPGDVTAT